MIFSIFFTILNILTHVKTKYSFYRKRPLVIIFSHILACNILLYSSLWIFTYAEPVFLVIQVLVATNMILIYNYIKESVMFYTCKAVKKDNKKFIEILGDKKKSDKMLKYDYPMRELNWFPRYSLADHFVAFWYIIEGKINIIPCWVRIKTNNFRKALKVQKIKTIYLWVFIILIPLLHLLDYLSNEVFDIDLRIVKVLLRVVTVVLTILWIITIKIFASNFGKTIKFEKFSLQLITILLLQGSFNILEAILVIIDPKMEDYSRTESVNLLFICIYSFILMIFAILQKFSFKAKSMYLSTYDDNKVAKLSCNSFIDDKTDP